MIKKKTIFFVGDFTENNGFTKKSIFFLNLLAKNYNIVLLYDNLLVNINSMLSVETKNSIIDKINFRLPEDKILKILDDDFEDIGSNNSKYDDELYQYLRNLKEKYQINKVVTFSSNISLSGIFLKEYFKLENLITTVDSILNIYPNNIKKFKNYKKQWFKLISKYSNTIIVSDQSLANLFNNKSIKIVPFIFDLDLFDQQNTNLEENIKQNYFANDIPKIGFFNLYDHTTNGLWDIIPSINKLTSNKKYQFIACGQAPKFWGNYLDDFLKFHKDNINDNMVFLGWKNDIIPYINGVDIVISSTQPQVLKFSNVIIEALLLNKKVITTNFNDYQKFEKYGIIFEQNKDEEISTVSSNIVPNNNIELLRSDILNSKLHILNWIKKGEL